MNERFQRISHKGKIVSYFDYRGLSSLNEAEFIKTIEAATEYFFKWGNNQVTLVDLREAYTNSNIINVWREAAKKSAPMISKSAILGISGAKAILVRGVNLFTKLDIRPFDTKEAALDWLVE